MSKSTQHIILYKDKKELYISKWEAEVNYKTCKIFRSLWRISLPPFRFEFSVEAASNRMIDFGSNPAIEIIICRKRKIKRHKLRCDKLAFSYKHEKIRAEHYTLQR